MKISVVTAVYNRADTIGDTMRSVASQSWGDIEHIVQDGGSRDGTLDVIERHCGPATQLTSEPDAGIYDALNKGIARASGDVIGLMHSDDIFASPLVLEKVAAKFAKTGADGIYGDLQYVSANDTGHVVRHWTSGIYRPAKLRRGWMPPHPTLYLRREVYERHGLFDTSFRIAADYDAMLRYLALGNITLGYVPEVLVKMRVGGESNRSLERIMLKSREDLRALRKNRVGGAATLAAKNFGKIGQFVKRDARPGASRHDKENRTA